MGEAAERPADGGPVAGSTQSPFGTSETAFSGPPVAWVSGAGIDGIFERMSEVLLYYRRPDPTTWVYLSSFLTVGLFFVFHRVWSVRNADLLLLILLGPGVLMVHEGYRRELVRQDEASISEAKSSNVPAAGQDALPDERIATNEISTNENSTGENSTNGSSTDGYSTNENSTNENSTSKDSTTVGGPASDAAGAPRTAENPARVQIIGFVYLFMIEMLLVVRLMLDPLMVRRPKLDPNLTAGGLTFIGLSLFIFMMANVVNSNARIQRTQGPALGPGYALMNMLPTIPTRSDPDLVGAGPLSLRPGETFVPTGYVPTLAGIAKTLAILAHGAIVSGIVLICNRHFGNLRAGMGCATLYLMLPYTAQMTGRVDHAVPAALLLWAVLFYRRPLVAGVFLGLAGGLVYYPLFLLPLWMSFYWRRGLRPFVVGVVAMLTLLMLLLLVDGSGKSLVEHLQQMFGILNPLGSRLQLQGFWRLGPDPIWRLPVIVAFVILSLFFAIWPAQKNLGTLIAGSAAVMASSQFWHGYGGGLYIAWFLPLLLLTIFRPNLQDRVATKVVRIRRSPAVAT